MSAFDDIPTAEEEVGQTIQSTISGPASEEYRRGYEAGLEAAEMEAEKQEERYEKKCDTWPEMQPNAIDGIHAVIDAIRALKEES